MRLTIRFGIISKFRGERIMFTAEEVVANSIKLLDDNVGKFDWLPFYWRNRIDLEKLEMGSVSLCILGQLWSAANDGESSGYRSATNDMSEIGIDYSSDRYEFGTYAAEWRRQLKLTFSNSGLNPGDKWFYSSVTTPRIVKSLSVVDGTNHVIYLGSDGRLNILPEEKFIN